MIVVDTNCLVKLFRDEPGHEEFRAWFANATAGAGLVDAPSVVRYELAIVIALLYQGRPRAELAEVHRRTLARVRTSDPAISDVFRIAAKGLTINDAAFVALASAGGATLVSADAEVLRVARRLRVRTKQF